MTVEQILLNKINIKVIPKQIKIGEYNINYLEAGSGDPLVLIHGANIGWGQWYRNIPELVKYYKVYALDLPGSGYSTKINFYTTNISNVFLEVVKKFIEKKKLQRVYYIGHSLGGWIGVKLAVDYNLIKKIVLVNPVGFCNIIPFKYRLVGIYPLAYFLSHTFFRPNISNLRSFLYGGVFDKTTIEQSFIQYYYETVNKEKITHPFLLINKISNFFKLNKEFLLSTDLQLKIPSLFIIGDRDSLNPSSVYLKLVPNIKNSKLCIINNCCHVPPLEHPDLFNKKVIRFFKKN